jgi:hypothetical protein
LRIFVVVCVPDSSSVPVVPDAEPWTFEPPPAMPGDTPVAALPLVFATPNPMLMTSDLHDVDLTAVVSTDERRL